MFLDNSIALSSSQALTSALSTVIASSSIYDVTGAGSGNAPAMIAGMNGSTGAAVPIGFDIGEGDGFAIPQVFWNVATAFVGGTSSTMQIKVQAAPDNGSNSPGVYQDLSSTKPYLASELTAGFSGVIPVPPTPYDFGEVQPRFYRLLYVMAAGATFSAGAVSANLTFNAPHALEIQNYPGNFVA